MTRCGTAENVGQSPPENFLAGKFPEPENPSPFSLQVWLQLEREHVSVCVLHTFLKLWPWLVCDSVLWRQKQVPVKCYHHVPHLAVRLVS